jgi:PilZ domain-containing protein
VDQPLRDRRTDARFQLPDASITRATLRPGCAVLVVDLSAGGALVQAAQPLRPGARVHLQLVTTVKAFALVARVLRCAVWTLHAEHGATYRGALQFEDRCEFFREHPTRDGSRIPAICSPRTEATGHAIPPLDGWSRTVRSRSVT